MTVQELDTAKPARTAFWVVAALGPMAATASWIWFGLALEEAQSEQGKALAADTTMAGFGEVVGGVPLIVAHLVGLLTLVVLGWKGYRAQGTGLSFLALGIASLIGIGVAQLLWGGELFELGIDNHTWVP